MKQITEEARRKLTQRRARLDPASRGELAEIDAALDRIARGTFGRCEVCGGPIGRLRLAAIPEARACTTCSSR
ncbi:MAG: TraR/DksA family transcriptional regulator [Myxococcota bacterium]